MSAAPLDLAVPTLRREFDLLDVALANSMLAVAQMAPLTSVGVDALRVEVSASGEQLEVLRAMFWQTEPEGADAWMHALAPRLVDGVIELVGPEWAAEAELSVELALALRADDMADLALALAGGAAVVSADRSAAAVVAADVPDPAMVYLV